MHLKDQLQDAADLGLRALVGNRGQQLRALLGLRDIIQLTYVALEGRRVDHRVVQRVLFYMNYCLDELDELLAHALVDLRDQLDDGLPVQREGLAVGVGRRMSLEEELDLLLHPLDVLGEVVEDLALDDGEGLVEVAQQHLDADVEAEDEVFLLKRCTWSWLSLMYFRICESVSFSSIFMMLTVSIILNLFLINPESTEM